MNQFNASTDKIAVVVKEFTLKRKSECFLDRYCEPYIVSVAIDKDGVKEQTIDFNIQPFPNVKRGDTIQFDGIGHLIYGPANPGEFVSYSILFMESDKDVNQLGDTILNFLKSEAIATGIKTFLVSNPTQAAIAEMIEELAKRIATEMKNNKDDELFRRNGTLLRDMNPPYDILRTYTSQNDFIKAKTAIIPLQQSSMQEFTQKVKL